MDKGLWLIWATLYNILVIREDNMLQRLSDRGSSCLMCLMRILSTLEQGRSCQVDYVDNLCFCGGVEQL